MSFDTIGSREKAVAILEGEDGEEKAKEIMEKNKNVKAVLEKVSGRKGELRLGEYKLIAGDENTEVIHKEYGYLLKLDPQKVYFSPREGSERQRIASQVKEGEKFLVLFSGVAPIAIAIAKKQPGVEKIYCVEKNEIAHKYAEENVRMNKLSDKVKLFCMDARIFLKETQEKFDRIIMPLPFGASGFLGLALNCLKEGGTIHYYGTGREEDPFSEVEKEIEDAANKAGKKVKILNEKKISQYAPRKWKVCIEFQVV